QPHPVLHQLNGIQYCVNSPPPWLEGVVLGFQHYLLAVGSVVMITSFVVSQMGGDNHDKVQVMNTFLFVSGINTLLHTFFGTQLPSVIGPSYAFIIPAASIIESRKYRAVNPPELRFAELMREIQGALIIASCFQIIFGLLGFWRNIVRLLSPLTMVPLVCLTGIGLCLIIFPTIANCAAVGIPQLLLIIFISQYLPIFLKFDQPVCDRYALLFSVAVISIYSEVLSVSRAIENGSNCPGTSTGLIKAAPWFYIPFPFQWGPPNFSGRSVFSAIAASLVASVESTGSFIAAARFGKATPIPPSVISRGTIWLGFATFLNAIFGSVTGSTALVENTGLLALTKTGSRRVVQFASIFMILLSVFGKMGAVFASIPSPIMAASYCIFLAYVSSAGLGFLQFSNLNSFRTKFILGISFLIGLALPRKCNDRNGSFHPAWVSKTLSDTWNVLITSHATVAATVAVILDSTLRKDGEGMAACRENGSYWWEKFMVYDRDARNEEFFGLPCGLDKCFPSV
ncbi:hypothetical protein M569_06991, partial [Genlisea aurea]